MGVIFFLCFFGLCFNEIFQTKDFEKLSFEFKKNSDNEFQFSIETLEYFESKEGNTLFLNKIDEPTERASIIVNASLSSPLLKKLWDTSARTLDTGFSDDMEFMYFSNGDHVIEMIELSDPNYPIISVPSMHPAGPAQEIQVLGNFSYFSCWTYSVDDYKHGGVTVLDLSQRDDPFIAGIFDTVYAYEEYLNVSLSSVSCADNRKGSAFFEQDTLFSCSCHGIFALNQTIDYECLESDKTNISKTDSFDCIDFGFKYHIDVNCEKMFFSTAQEKFFIRTNEKIGIYNSSSGGLTTLFERNLDLVFERYFYFLKDQYLVWFETDGLSSSTIFILDIAQDLSNPDEVAITNVTVDFLVKEISQKVFASHYIILVENKYALPFYVYDVSDFKESWKLVFTSKLGIENLPASKLLPIATRKKNLFVTSFTSDNNHFFSGIHSFGNISIFVSATEIGNFTIDFKVEDNDDTSITFPVHIEIKCPSGWIGETCDIPICYGFLANDTENVCNGRGNCSSPDICTCPTGLDHMNNVTAKNCSCYEGYEGENCEVYYCSRIPSTSASVCSGNGHCDKPNYCTCKLFYSGDDCSSTTCNNISNSDESVCSGHGDCVGFQNCSCEPGYFSLGEEMDCSTPMCFGSLEGNSGCVNGECVAPDKCDCMTGFSGKQCDKNLREIFALIIGIPLGSVVVLVLCCCCLVLFFFLAVAIAGGVAIVFSKSKKQKNDLLRGSATNKIDELLSLELSEENQEILNNINFDLSLFNIPFDLIHLKKELGSGAGGTVYLAEWESKDVALKLFRLKKYISEYELNEFQNEVKFISKLRHPNIISFYGGCFKYPKIGFVMEFCPNGDLKDFLLKSLHYEPHEPVKLSLKIQLLEEIAQALRFLHSKNICHRDLKPENVLISGDFHAKLMDFGLSREMSGEESKTKGVGTGLYMAPEITRGENYDMFCDVFSFSILSYCILFDTFNPYASDNDDEEGREKTTTSSTTNYVEFKVANDPSFRPKFQNVIIQSELKKLLEMTWKDNPEDRLTFENIQQVLEDFKEKKILNVSSRTVYLRKQENNEDFEDIELKEFTLTELHSHAQKMLQQPQNVENIKLMNLIEEKGGRKRFIPIKNDNDVQMLDEESLIVFNKKE